MFPIQAIKPAFRALGRTPIITLIAVVSLAFGIGANSAIFSLFHQILMQPLPVESPEELVNLKAPGPKSGYTSCNDAGGCDEILSYPMFLDLERASGEVLRHLVAHRSFGANLGYNGQTLSGSGSQVSGSYFPALGLAPALGRLIGPTDDDVIGQLPVAVLSHEYWSSRFGRDPSVLDETLLVNGQPLTIVGVAPEGFRGTTLGQNPEIFVPITLRPLLDPTFEQMQNRQGYWVYSFGRLKPGVSMERAELALNQTYSSILAEVEVPLQEGMSEQTLERFRAKQLVLAEGTRGQSGVRGESKTALLLLFSVAGVVLLIACANVANLLLARSASRSGEIAVRMSMGASRPRLIRQLLAEACALALLGGVAGLAVAYWTLSLLRRMLPPEAVEILRFGLDWEVAAFAAVLSLGTGVLFGLFPAFQATNMELSTALRRQAGQGGHGAGSRGASRFRVSLVTAQIALSTALLVSAGLFTRSLVNVGRIDLGVEVDSLVTFGIAPVNNGYEPDESLALFVRAEEELSALPGVEGVTAALVPLLAGSNWGSNVTVEGFETDLDTDTNSRYNEVGPGYFHTVGIPLLAGREFTAADIQDRPKVVIVNETFAEKFDLGREAVGKRMTVGGGQDAELDMEIVGLVKDAKYSNVKDEIPPLFFTPYRQDEELGFINFYVRTGMDPSSLMPTLRESMRRLDPNLPVDDMKTMPQQVRESVFLDRFLTTLSAAFALLATVLAAVGLYGVLAYTVAQRRREFGVRMALGANGASVSALVLRQLGKMAIIGGVLGVAGAIGVGTLARSQLYGVEGYDPFVLSASVLLLSTIALAAGLVPARRAATVDPMTVLRDE
ncbi:MAG: ABC transporter permease [Thermoanaerobaculia bacterium]|nr:ABC transporter permease [Thermoanaerobaculia bacterium]